MPKKYLKPFPLSAADVLRPNRNQDGFCYVRMPRIVLTGIKLAGSMTRFFYDDSKADDRVISSRKAEEGAELHDLIRLCKNRGLWFSHEMNAASGRWTWYVGGIFTSGHVGKASTLRGAYYDWCQRNVWAP